MSHFDFIAIDAPAAKFAVAGVQVDPMLAGEKREDLLQIPPKFAGGAGLSRIMARRDEAPAEGAAPFLESTHIVPLPAMERYRHPGKGFEGTSDVHSEEGEAFAGELEGGFDIADVA